MEKKANGLSLLRVIAMCMILVVHFGQSLPFPSVLHTPIVFCQHGVQLFFLISGFLIFKSLDRNPNVKEFYLKRFFRIVPVYWAVVLLNFVIFNVVLKVMPEDEFHLGWIRYFLFIQTFVPTKSVEAWNNLSALWTMSAFAFFYVIAPLFHKLMDSYKKASFTVILALMVSICFTSFVGALAKMSMYSDSLIYISGKSPVAVLWIFLVGGLIVQVIKEKRGGGYYYRLEYGVLFMHTSM